MRNGGFNLSRRIDPPELIANMQTYWLNGFKISCGTMRDGLVATPMQQIQEQQDHQLEAVEHQQGI